MGANPATCSADTARNWPHAKGLLQEEEGQHSHGLCTGQTLLCPWRELHPGRHCCPSFKLNPGPDHATTLDHHLQTKEICSHFVNSINQHENNKNFFPNPLHPYFWALLQKAISVQVLYDFGVDSSCISHCVFQALPPECKPHL